MPKQLSPKDFIQEFLIEEIEEIHQKHQYISFALMAIGIEFLGKCLNEFEDWNKPQSKTDFNYAINNLEAFKQYRPLIITHNLWNNLRNGFAHSFVPKGKIALSSNRTENEEQHMTTLINGAINLKCEEFYADFKKACEEVIAKTSFKSSKMNKPLLDVPIQNQQGIGGTNVTGKTYF